MRILSLFLILYIAGCASPARSLCGYEYCGQDQWQKAINTITLANFPNETYEGVLWKDDFKNAWVTIGNTINITAEMNYHLVTQSRRAAVVAHEIAHLKKGHYYQHIGAVIVANAAIITAEVYVPGSQYYSNSLGNIGVAAFSRKHESEADALAIKYLRKAGYSKEDFLDLLYWMRDTLPNDNFNPLLSSHPHISERITDIKKLR